MTTETKAISSRPNVNSRARADVTTPLRTEDLPADLPDVRTPKATEEKAKKPTITLSTTVQHRGRVIVITATDVTVDRFCDLLDQAAYAAPAPAQWQTLPDGTPLCPKHNVPMRKREKQGDLWWSHRVFDADGTEVFCKGYHGKDSPGYEH